MPLKKNRRAPILFLLIFLPIFKLNAVESNLEEALLSIRINSQNYNSIVTAYKDATSFYILKSDMISYRIKDDLMTSALITIANQEYVDISKLKSVKYTFIKRKLLLDIEIPPEYFLLTTIDFEKPKEKIDYMSGEGAYLNYGVYYNGYQTPRIHERQISTLPEIVLFNDYGSGSSSFFLQETLHGSKQWENMRAFEQSKAIRLDTFWLYDSPNTMQRIRLGDSITRATDWGGAARFIGIKFAKDFSIQPGFITSPRPSINGTAAVPSVLDVFVNNVKVQSGQAPSGNFFLENIPVINGSGMVELQVRDITGSVSTIQVPYYASTSLLKPGLNDYSFEAGKIREYYGIKSNAYTEYFASGIYRYGITNFYTAGVHAEVMKKLQLASFDNSVLVGNYGTASFSIAGSKKYNKLGRLMSFGLQRQDNISFGGLITINSKHFSDISTFPHSYFTSRNIRSYLGTTLPDYSSVNSSFTIAKDRQNSLVKLLDLAYQKQILPSTNFAFSIGHNYGSQHYTYAFLSINVSLGDSRSTSVFVSKNNNRYRETLDYSKNSGTLNGLNYRLQVAHEHSPELHGEVRYGNNFADMTGRVSKYHDYALYQVNSKGSIFVANNDLHFSRPIYGCVAIIKVDDYKGINVYKDNHHIGKTNENGIVAIYDIQSYTPSTIRVNEKDLPIHANIDKHEKIIYCKTSNIIFVPFGIKRSRLATFNLIDSTGDYIPPATRVKIGEKEVFTGHYGMVFLDNILELEHINGMACKDNSCCNFKVSIPSDGEAEHINLGDVRCTK
jgi:outer membrane usher protein